MIDTRKLTALLALGMTVGALAACGTEETTDDGDGSTGGTTAGAGEFPTDTSASGIAAFLATESYKQAPWAAQEDAPRPSPAELASISPHGMVRVYLNPTLKASIAAGDGDGNAATSGNPLAVGSMVVKELYDSSGQILVGRAANLKVTEGSNWTFFCYGPENQCSLGTEERTADNPLYGVGLGSPGGCGTCHGDLVMSPQRP